MKTQALLCVFAVGIAVSFTPTHEKVAPSVIPSTVESNEAPDLSLTPPRKIFLMVEPTPFTYVCGYTNRFNEMLRYLSKAKDHVVILTTDSVTPKEELPKEKYGRYTIEHTKGFTLPLYEQMSMTFDLPEMKGASILDKFKKPDLIHASSPGFLQLASLFYARVMRIPLVLSYHTHLPSYAKNYIGFVPGHEQLAWFILKWVHSRADLTLCTSPQIKEEMESNGIPRVDVWRKGIDTIRFHPKFYSQEMREKMTDGNPDEFTMVYVGRLGAEKRLMDIKPILEQMPNARLCIVGFGPQEEELHEHFKGTNTVFTGVLSGDALSSAFASADAFIMPSDSETLGFVVLESMASGVPVVGCAAGGILNLIHNSVDGFLVQPGDTNGYVAKLKLLQDAKTREIMGQNARTEAEKWSWEAATSVLRNIQYERAIINFESRAFNGFGKPGTKHMLKSLEWKVKYILAKTGFRKEIPKPESA